MRDIYIKPTRTTRICSIRGCGNKDTVLVARSADFRGGIRLCKDCVRSVMAWFDARDAKPEVLVDPAPVTEETVEKVEPVKPKGKKNGK